MDLFVTPSNSSMTPHPLDHIKNHPLNRNLVCEGVDGPVAWRRADGKIIPYPGITTRLRKKLYPKYVEARGTSSRNQGTRVHR